MCGIAGFLDPKRRSGDADLRALAAGMAGALHHRGPDDSGVWVDAEAGIALGHARLSIIDLSAAGAQPMASNSGRFVLSYNGEIHNAGELRAELEQKGHSFRGHSATEVLVEVSLCGVRATVECLIGMLAFAVFDKATRRLILGRDRLGHAQLLQPAGEQAAATHKRGDEILRRPTLPQHLGAAALPCRHLLPAL